MFWSRKTPNTVAAPVVVLHGAITEPKALSVTANLLFQVKEQAGPVVLDIDSPGGDINASLAIYDTVKTHRARVRTTCRAQAAGQALLILAAGAPGFRSVSQDSVLAFAPLTGIESAPAAEVLKLEHFLAEAYAELSNLTRDDAIARGREGRWLTPAEALAAGLIDAIA
jgi:ATP-dependent Clp protease protease subunit